MQSVVDVVAVYKGAVWPIMDWPIDGISAAN